FMGTGTTAVAAQRCGRDFVGFELNSEYCAIIEARLAAPQAQFTEHSNQPTEPVRSKLTEIKKGSRKKKSAAVPADSAPDVVQQAFAFDHLI
ncbi:MAG: DNA methyltransferase, partial [Oxalobacteraceae bacterium]